jgi:GrpB-like predicted nucleotidyltransferase (UPF0157 family)
MAFHQGASTNQTSPQSATFAKAAPAEQQAVAAPHSSGTAAPGVKSGGLVLGVDFGKVKVVPYRPEWAAIYVRERDLIQAALDGAIAGIEHIGSTSIPGMPSKPILDIMVIMHCNAEIGQLVDGLCTIGYHYEPDEPVPERHFFVKPPLPVPHRTHHLSLTTAGSSFWRNNVAFREYMLNHADEAVEYGALKTDLATRHPDDRAAYTAAKQPYIRRVLAAALREFSYSNGTTMPCT